MHYEAEEHLGSFLVAGIITGVSAIGTAVGKRVVKKRQSERAANIAAYKQAQAAKVDRINRQAHIVMENAQVVQAQKMQKVREQEKKESFNLNQAMKAGGIVIGLFTLYKIAT